MIHPDLQALQVALQRVVSRDPHELADAELMERAELLFTARNVLDGRIAAEVQVVHTRDLSVGHCGLKTKNWMVSDHRLSVDEAATFLTVARALPHRPHVAQALAAGEIGVQHARRIATSTRKVPVELSDVFEKELVEAARDVDPTSLGSFARELRSRLGADESREAAEARQYADRWVQMDRTFDGMTSISGMLDPASAAIINRALAPLLGKAGPEDDRSLRQRRADALTSACELALATGGLPQQGGQKPQVIAKVFYQDLKNDLDAQAAGLLDAYQVSISTIRMVACDAGIIPALLASTGEVLDLGRKTPTWTVAQHRALEAESSGTCGFAGCDTPLAYCQIHHVRWWARDKGPTSTENGIHLCRFHHWLVHHSDWQIEKTGPGQLRAWRD